MSAERILLCLGLAGCGSLVDASYRGDVLLRVEGNVMIQEDAQLNTDVGVAILWAHDPRPNYGAEAVVVDTSFPARYELKLYRPPSETSLVPLLGQDNLRVSVGQIVLFADRDGNGRWAGPDSEPVVGGSFDSAVLWVQQGYDDGLALSDLGAYSPRETPVWSEGLHRWIPKTGYQLVTVPVSPTCGLDLNDVLFDRPTDRAILHVGSLNTSYDWDCDGTHDYGTSGAPSHQDSDTGWWFDDETCPPPYILADECLFLQSVVHSEDPAWLDPIQFLYSDTWIECLAQTCPTTIHDFVALTNR